MNVGLVTALVRDQKPLTKGDLVEHLDGMTQTEWLRTLNDRVFLFARVDVCVVTPKSDRKYSYSTFVPCSRKQKEGSKLPTNSGALPRKIGCPCRGLRTFAPFESWGALSGQSRKSPLSAASSVSEAWSCE